MVPLKDIVPAAQNNINTRFILLDKGIVKTTTTTLSQAQNKTCLALVADETAAVHFQLWGNECDAFEPGDIVELSNGIFSYCRNNLLLRAGKIEKVGEFMMAYVETPNLSEIRWVPDTNNPKKYIQETDFPTFSYISTQILIHEGEVDVGVVTLIPFGFTCINEKSIKLSF